MCNGGYNIETCPVHLSLAVICNSEQCGQKLNKGICLLDFKSVLAGTKPNNYYIHPVVLYIRFSQVLIFI